MLHHSTAPRSRLRTSVNIEPATYGVMTTLTHARVAKHCAYASYMRLLMCLATKLTHTILVAARGPPPPCYQVLLSARQRSLSGIVVTTTRRADPHRPMFPLMTVRLAPSRQLSAARARPLLPARFSVPTPVLMPSMMTVCDYVGRQLTNGRFEVFNQSDCCWRRS